jgi:hypothetical protein
MATQPLTLSLGGAGKAGAKTRLPWRGLLRESCVNGPICTAPGVLSLQPGLSAPPGTVHVLTGS